MSGTPHTIADWEKKSEPVPLRISEDSETKIHTFACKRCGVFGRILVQISGHMLAKGPDSDELTQELERGKLDLIDHFPVCPGPAHYGGKAE